MFWLSPTMTDPVGGDFLHDAVEVHEREGRSALDAG
jgi:hypothetical protein